MFVIKVSPKDSEFHVMMSIEAAYVTFTKCFLKHYGQELWLNSNQCYQFVARVNNTKLKHCKPILDWSCGSFGCKCCAEIILLALKTL